MAKILCEFDGNQVLCKVTENMGYDPLLATAALSGCEIVKCKYYKDGKCNDPNEYVNKHGESVCGRREDAILYEDYLEMLNDNPPMMPFDRPAEF